MENNTSNTATFNVTFEATPNPATMKFLLHKNVLDRSFAFEDADDAESSPLAAKIFGFPWVSGVFLGENFLTVTKQDWVEWEYLAAPLANLIQEHLQNNEALIVDVIADNQESDDDSPVVKEIKKILNREIRPVVALDGGDIVFSKYENNILYVHMMGACSGCPSSTATLKEGVEARMKEALPEILEVRSV